MELNNLVTITFPVYERYTYFEEALESAINQTVACPIIVVDNASSHTRFKQICEKYKTRVTYFRNEMNLGMFPNWNKCFEYAQTPFAMIVGDDDVLCPTYIEEFISSYNSNHEIGLYYTDIVFLQQMKGTHSFEEVECGWKNIWGKTTVRGLKENSWNNQLDLPSISCIINVQLQRSVRFETGLHTANDKLLIYSLPDNTVVWGNPNKLYKYRRHDSNDSTGGMLPVLLAAHMLMFYTMREYSKLNMSQKRFCYRYLMYSLIMKRGLYLQIKKSHSAYKSIINDMISCRHLFYIAIEFIPSIIICIKKKLIRK